MATEGRGFVHLNTPASIQYTAAQKVSLSAVKAQKSRVETVHLPPWMRWWRAAQQQFVQRHGYSAYPTDKEDVRDGNGPVYPPLAVGMAHPAFFVSTSTSSRGQGSSGATAPAAASSSSTGVGNAGGGTAGLTIVSHHKVSGECQFTYPDYDGVLSGGVVPQVVLTPEEIQEEEAKRALYVTPLELTDEEAAALEELQALWKSRSLSHSFDGAQHRAAEGGTARHASSRRRRYANQDGGEEETGEESATARKRRRAENSSGSHQATALGTAAEPDEEDDESENGGLETTAMQDFDEALRMADELLRFA